MYWFNALIYYCIISTVALVNTFTMQKNYNFIFYGKKM